ncbi:hypothetical protein PFLUV_G00182350 [Perca fluviatilis]|uniref:Uncharacterized protein n=1 Tax=Perca fluviatilis TaxID=8168 RepID=A0A6A5ENS2_PERFL|nr:hypothetical protein PFLUV_G00182350 [Perca fluviatilis]
MLTGEGDGGRRLLRLVCIYKGEGQPISPVRSLAKFPKESCWVCRPVCLWTPSCSSSRPRAWGRRLGLT